MQKVIASESPTLHVWKMFMEKTQEGLCLATTHRQIVKELSSSIESIYYLITPTAKGSGLISIPSSTFV